MPEGKEINHQPENDLRGYRSKKVETSTEVGERKWRPKGGSKTSIKVWAGRRPGKDTSREQSHLAVTLLYCMLCPSH